MVDVRDERSGDISAIREVNQLAFEQDQEANLVDALRANGGALMSLVATVDGRVAGHVMYSPLWVGDVEAAALAPLAVRPDHQRLGIGSKLVEAGNRRLKDSGCDDVFMALILDPGTLATVSGLARYRPEFSIVA